MATTLSATPVDGEPFIPDAFAGKSLPRESFANLALAGANFRGSDL